MTYSNYNLKTIETAAGDVLDLTGYEFNSVQEIVNVVMQTCEKYHLWAPSKLPDIVKLNPEQRKMFPAGIWYMTTPHNVIEMITPGVDNRILDKQNPLDNNSQNKLIT